MNFNPELLPVLTETADGTVLELPTLTETVEEHKVPALRFSDEQCRQLAEYLFPRLEETLLNALSASPEANWQTAMQQVRAALPKLILTATQQTL